MKVIIAVVLACVIATPAEARHRRDLEPNLMQTVAGAVQRVASKVAHAMAAGAATAAETVREAPERLRLASYETAGTEETVPNPAGCPPIKFCGCGVSVKVYGHPVPDLFRADEWPRRFPRATCAAGNVMHWSGHVAFILECRGDQARLWDPNSGRHETHVHWVSIAGADILAP
jgi:hypothetical protein